jgi:cobalt/nickel transport system permease protein
MDSLGATTLRTEVHSAEPPDGRVVLVGLLACIVVTALTPAGQWQRLLGEAALVAAVHAALSASAGSSGYACRAVMGRLALLLPALLLVLVSAPFMAGASGPPPPLERAAAAGARAVISFGALAAALRAVEAPELLRALARLRAPAILVTLMALLLRYLGLLEGEVARMMLARDLRGRSPGLRVRARVAGCMVGSLFLRSVERSERVSLAMQARGFTGLLPAPPPRPLTARAAALLGALLLAQLLLVGVT